MTQPKRSNQHNALTLMLGTLGSRISGFLRQSLLTQLFDERITDAFFVALSVPNLVRELLAEGALTNSFIPVYSSLDKEEAKKLSAALLGLLLIANGFLLFLAFFLAISHLKLPFAATTCLIVQCLHWRDRDSLVSLPITPLETFWGSWHRQ